jgi:hypothetical protein
MMHIIKMIKIKILFFGLKSLPLKKIPAVFDDIIDGRCHYGSLKKAATPGGTDHEDMPKM